MFGRVLPTFSWMAAHTLATLLLFGTVTALAAVWVRNVGQPSSRSRRRTAAIVMWLVAGLLVAVAGSMLLVQTGRWGCVLALLPGVVIARYAVYMRLVRRRALFSTMGRSGPPSTAATGNEENMRLEREDLAPVFARARQAYEQDFAPDTLAIRYGVPALLTTLIGIGVFETLRLLQGQIAPQALRAAWLGSGGALVYVMLYLGQRGFRRDITSGAAAWSAVVMALGPLFGAVLATIFRVSSGGDPAASGTWTSDALYFVAGMSPRHVASAVEDGVRRVWLGRGTAAAAQLRSVPLTQLRGVGPEIEERLGEEGITDAYALAAADPLKLMRNTSYDKRQILGWMDEAMLMTWLPEYWTILEKLGVTGALDLMSHVSHRLDPLKAMLAGAKLEAAQINAIELAAGVLREDGQARLIMALYQFDDEDGFDLANAAQADVGSDGAAAPGPEGEASSVGGWFGLALALTGAALLVRGSSISLGAVLAPLAMAAVGVLATLMVKTRSRRVRQALIGVCLAVAAGLSIAGLALETLPRWLGAQVPAGRLLFWAAAFSLGVFLAQSGLTGRKRQTPAEDVAPALPRKRPSNGSPPQISQPPSQPPAPG